MHMMSDSECAHAAAADVGSPGGSANANARLLLLEESQERMHEQLQRITTMVGSVLRTMEANMPTPV